MFRSNQLHAAVAVTVAAMLVAAACHHPGRQNRNPESAARSSTSPGAHSPPPKLAFNEDIEPILSENCYPCHGPDPGTRKAGLRLDRPEFAFAPHEKSGPALVRGDPDGSPLIRRVESADPKQFMPPPEAHKTLQPEEIARLRRWVREGAGYQDHWSFIAPVRETPPAARHPGWAKNEIDRFVLARLDREGLEPSPDADRISLIRRVAYDLTGLPPAPEAVAAFVHDPSPQAYEKVVDGLLANPHYGEHRAHYWLDAVRFADTHGLHLDKQRSIWPYRDYVIRSFNANKPFDQFTREQLAGDLLPPENVDHLVATALLRAGISNSEGGSIEEELRTTLQKERTEVFSAVFLGLTTGCAACHDHKFDPTTQRDFYRLGAFFSNLSEFASNQGNANWPPFIRVPKPYQRPAADALLAQRADAQRKLAARRSQADSLIAAWLAHGATLPVAVSNSGLAVRLRFDEGKGLTAENSAPGAAVSQVAMTGGGPEWGENTWLWPSFRMSANTRVELPESGDAAADQPFSVGVWLMPHYEDGASATRPLGAIVARVDATAESRGWGLYRDAEKPAAAAGRLSFRLVSRWPWNALEVKTSQLVLTRSEWTHVLATYDGSGTAAGVRLYVNGAPQELVITADLLGGDVRCAAPMQLGREHPNDHPLREARYQDFRFYSRRLADREAACLPYEDLAAEIVARPRARWSEDEFKIVSDFYFTHRDEPARTLAARIDQLTSELDRLAADGDPCLVCAERPQLAYANILTRGVYHQRAERVRPAVPHFLPQLPPGAPLNRRGLADWVVRADHPLTARVTVNRMWQELFGLGFVETTGDFGLVGERPTHRALLDWLAVDFRESGWDVKRFYKQVVMSATYRQSARVTAALLEKDPANRLLARGPRFRMDAEMLRDTALSASGLLVEKIGGPSVKPYQPAGVWEALAYPDAPDGSYKADHYVADQGEGLYRRSLYTYWKRQASLPNMEIFDQPVRMETCTRRQRANTPLQALVAMNDPQWLEAARRLAERVMLTSPAFPERLDHLGRLLLGRPWRPAEQAVLAGAYQKFHDTYADDPAAAARLVAQGESAVNPAIAPADLAPWMLVASTALNLDATLNK